MKRDPWFTADKEGLAKLVRRKGLSYVLYELIQNTWDTRTESVRVEVENIGPGKVRVYVEDQDPDGFKDLSHAYTLFAESEKKGDPSKRGRFNLGEKLVLAICEEAEIISTKGSVHFTKEGRTTGRKKLERGSAFSGVLRMTLAEMSEMVASASLLIPPIPTFVNGERIELPKLLHYFEATLPTEVSDEEGVLRRTRRKTVVRVWEGKGWIYEMGIPVCETGDPWTVEVDQKVPLNADRDNVTPAYLQELRVAVVNAMHDRLEAEAMRSPAVSAALTDDRIKPEAVKTVVTAKYGEKVMVADVRDQEANHRAMASGFTVIPGSAFSGRQWAQIRGAGAIPVTTTQFATQIENSGPRLSEDKLTKGMQQVALFAKALAKRLLGRSIKIRFFDAPGKSFQAAYGQGALAFNIGTLGPNWFDRSFSDEGVLDLLLHEFAHDAEGNHLSSAYHNACTQLGAKLAVLALNNPELFDRKSYVGLIDDEDRL